MIFISDAQGLIICAGIWSPLEATIWRRDDDGADLSNATSKDPALRRALAADIRNACVTVGFFYVKNHGIPEEVINKAVGAAERFFSIPIEAKMKLDIHASPNFKGYTALLGENVNLNNKGDLHEAFDVGWESERTVYSSDGAMVGSNDVLTYYDAAVRLGLSLFPLFALALDLPEDFFADKVTKQAAIVRLLHYPPQPRTTNGGSRGYECFTVLWQQEDTPALQVMNTDGKWIDAIPIPGTLVLNLGDQLARWTNDVFKSTVHRAVNRTGKGRYSIPLFFGVDYNVILEPLPGCVTPDNPAKYEVVTAGEYVKSRLEATYAQSRV
ncbi:Clavaminate synthase-like protein [Pisolithus albus]|nr:Clavaminate synthase-like protein [Pisolithus albus]